MYMHNIIVLHGGYRKMNRMVEEINVCTSNKTAAPDAQPGYNGSSPEIPMAPEQLQVYHS